MRGDGEGAPGTHGAGSSEHRGEGGSVSNQGQRQAETGRGSDRGDRGVPVDAGAHLSCRCPGRCPGGLRGSPRKRRWAKATGKRDGGSGGQSRPAGAQPRGSLTHERRVNGRLRTLGEQGGPARMPGPRGKASSAAHLEGVSKAHLVAVPGSSGEDPRSVEAPLPPGLPCAPPTGTSRRAALPGSRVCAGGWRGCASPSRCRRSRRRGRPGTKAHGLVLLLQAEAQTTASLLSAESDRLFARRETEGN